jgi:peptidoglycan/xylan/chitin deacetylase (PgdA/CDA1 family)
MKQFRNTVIRAGLGALYFSGAHLLLRPIFAGVGAIFMLHHVRPRRDAAFQPNRHLEVTPEFLRDMLIHLRSRGIDIISMDEVRRRLIERDFSRRFASFTLDDGYRDNRDFALPVMQEFDAPLTLYVTSDFADGSGRLWWIALEMAIARASSIEMTIGGMLCRLDTVTSAAKQAAFDRLHETLRGLPEHALRHEMTALRARHGVDDATICRNLCMSWDELKPFAAHPLVTIGSHTVSHCNLAAEDEESARRELTASRADRGRAAAAGRPPRLPLWRQSRRRAARIRVRWRCRIPHGGDDAAGDGVSGKRRPSHRAAAGLAQRQLPGQEDPAGPHLGRRDRHVERVPPRRRGVIPPEMTAGLRPRLSSRT